MGSLQGSLEAFTGPIKKGSVRSNDEHNRKNVRLQQAPSGACRSQQKKEGNILLGRDYMDP